MLAAIDLRVYRGPAPVLHGVTLQVDEGEIVAVVGPNGAGKSTLLGALAGCFPPAAGRVMFAGEDVTGTAPETLVRRGLVLVPERRQVFPGLTVRDNLLLGAYHWYRRNKGEAAALLDAVLADFPRLRERIGQLAGSLSGGEQQMLAIGRGIMARPRVLLLDEPSLGLAPKVVTDLFSRFRQLCTRYGTAMILVEQNVRAAFRVADRTYVLERGRVVREGPVEALREDPHVVGAYLGKRLPAALRADAR
ncbi:ABC transporter ATP-binding protein [Calditerricola yamamurae]